MAHALCSAVFEAILHHQNVEEANVHELVCLGIALRVLRGCHSGPCEDWSSGNQLQPSDGYSHRGDSNIRLVGRSFYEEPADLDDWKTNLDFFDFIWCRNGTVLAVLLPGIATWRGLARGPVDKLSVAIAIALAAIFLREQLTWHTGREDH